MPADDLREPWRSFFHDLDHQLAGPTEIHCFGGFVITEFFGLTRATADVDILAVRGHSDLRALQEAAGRGSALARRHKVHLDIVTVATVPADYESRLVEIYAGEFKRFRIKALEHHDLALAKLARNADHDREDVKRLALTPGLDTAVLRERYQQEMRYQFSNERQADLTLELWVEMVAEVRDKARGG